MKKILLSIAVLAAMTVSAENVTYVAYGTTTGNEVSIADNAEWASWSGDNLTLEAGASDMTLKCAQTEGWTYGALCIGYPYFKENIADCSPVLSITMKVNQAGDEGRDWYFDNNMTLELSTSLNGEGEVKQSVDNYFGDPWTQPTAPRDGDWHTVELKLSESFPQVLEAIQKDSNVNVCFGNYFAKGESITVNRVAFITDGNTGVATLATDTQYAPAEYYNLSGVRVDPANLGAGLYIVRQGTSVKKVIIK